MKLVKESVMKNAPLLLLVALMWCGCAVCDAQIGATALKGCGAAEHGRSDKAEVLAFVNGILESEGLGGMSPMELMEFRWVDLAGDGRCELLFTRWGSAVTRLYIEWPDSVQVLSGEANFFTKNLSRDWQKKVYKSSIRDLNGDGKKEIIMGSYLVPGGRRGATPTPMWPQVYRLEGEKYVPASRDFLGFYDREILPDLNSEITETPPGRETVVAALEMERDKIQRVLGRDPNAGLGKARNWAMSENPDMIENAMAVFRDIPGHEAEAKAAEQAWKQALRRQNANRNQ